jgi:SAM-dependent methyltransferase
MIFRESSTEFRGLPEWRAWLRANGWAHDKPYIESMVRSIADQGLIDPELGFVAPAEIEIQGSNFRETIVARSSNSRMRGVLLHIIDFRLERGAESSVYASESITPFAARLRVLFPRFRGSEYLPTVEERAKFPQVEHQDVQSLTYPDSSFDAYISCEVFEHVPSIDRTLAEAFRILKTQGRLIAMFPFAYSHEKSIEKARLVDGRIVFLQPAEYHGNPIDPKGSLVFTIPAWDIVDRCCELGFRDAYFSFDASRRHGITGAELAGTFTLIADR